jgi:hypothetical protein
MFCAFGDEQYPHNDQDQAAHATDNKVANELAMRRHMNVSSI